MSSRSHTDVIKDWQLFKLEKGEWIFGYPFGYYTIGESRIGKYNFSREVVIDHDKMNIVIDIFNTFSKGGYGLNQITEYVTRKWNLKMHRSSIHRMLVNKFYMGIMVFKSKQFPHHYPTFITKEIFEKCQEVLKNNNKHSLYIPKM